MYCDRRIANTNRWSVWPPGDANMRVPDVVTRSVIFLGELKVLGKPRAGANFASLQPRGTGFIVGQPSEFGDGHISRFLYLVTARHVIDGLKSARCGGRINRKDGTAEMIDLGTRWWFHPSDPKNIDIAVIPFGGHYGNPEEFEYSVIPTESFATDQTITDMQMGVGDEVFLTGLFAHNLNSGPNRPIVRMGNIALLAGEPIIAGPRKMRAHLIEARSIGGLSGSPAFIRQTVSIVFAHPTEFKERELYRRMQPNEVPSDALSITGVGPFYLLGLMHGHWDILPEQKNEIFVSDEKGTVNMGIALVVPAAQILEVINQPELADMRRKLQDDLEKGRAKPTLDNLTKESDPEGKAQMLPKGARIAIPMRGAFMRDLEKATRRKKPSS